MIDDLGMRAVLTSARRRGSGHERERALLEATEDLTLCCAAAWERLRQRGTTAEQLYAQLQESRFLVRELRDWIDLLGDHIVEREPRRRHRYSPGLRFRVLEYMRKYMLSVEETARRFHVTQQTIYNWLADHREHPEAKTIGSLVKAVPPLRTISEVTRRLCRNMKAFGFGGKKKIAEIITRNVRRTSARSVGRFLNESPATPPPIVSAHRSTTVRGDRPNHLWLVDITKVPW